MSSPNVFAINVLHIVRWLLGMMLILFVSYLLLLFSFFCDYQVTFNPSGTRLAVLDIAGGVSVVETSENAANASVLGRR